MKLRIKGENFAWRLSEELLRREMPTSPRPDHRPGQSAPTQSDAQADLLTMLRQELEIKNQQIRTQSELLSKHIELVTGLSERLREGNILIGSLQQRLALTDGRQAAPVDAAEPKRGTAPAPKKGTATPPKPAKAKRGFFSRLFRS